jgi:7-carboxy-7-deazaguanine synthase
LKRYKVKETFGPTIQGEGSATGSPVLFLRFSGCNRWSGRQEDKAKSICNFCDTDFLGGEMMTAQDIVDSLKFLSTEVRTVVVSGGEPTLQIDEELLKALTGAGFRLHLETNGSKALGELGAYFAHISMSPKQTREETKLEHADDIKMLYPWIKEGISRQAFCDFPHRQMYIQPLWESDKKAALQYIYDFPELKLSAQLHKYIEVL